MSGDLCYCLDLLCSTYFFIISGFFVSNSEKRKRARASFDQIIRILKLYLVWSVIYLLIMFLVKYFSLKKASEFPFSARDFPCLQRALCIPAHEGMLHSVAFPLEDQ